MSKRKKIVLIAISAAVLVTLVIAFFTTGIWEFLCYKYDMNYVLPVVEALLTHRIYVSVKCSVLLFFCHGSSLPSKK